MTNKEKIRAFLKDYGDSFRQMRHKSNFTQKRVAEKVKCSQAIISHIECGYMLPPPHIENALLNLYEINEK